MQFDAERRIHSLLNFILEFNNVGGARASAVDDGQRVLARDSHGSALEPLAESGVFNQPGGRDFYFLVAGRESRHALSPCCRLAADLFILGWRDDGVLEKTSRTAAIRVALHQQHGFAAPNLAHGLAGLLQSGGAAGKEFFQVRIFDMRGRAWHKRKRYMQNNIAPASGGIKDAGAISEAGVAVFDLANLVLFQIEHADASNRLRHFLPVGSHVLHGSSTHGSGNSAQAFNASAVQADGVRYESFPVFAGPGFKDDFVALIRLLNPAQRNSQDYSLPT